MPIQHVGTAPQRRHPLAQFLEGYSGGMDRSMQQIQTQQQLGMQEKQIGLQEAQLEMQREQMDREWQAMEADKRMQVLNALRQAALESPEEADLMLERVIERGGAFLDDALDMGYVIEDTAARHGFPEYLPESYEPLYRWRTPAPSPDDIEVDFRENKVIVLNKTTGKMQEILHENIKLDREKVGNEMWIYNPYTQEPIAKYPIDEADKYEVVNVPGAGLYEVHHLPEGGVKTRQLVDTRKVEPGVGRPEMVQDALKEARKHALDVLSKRGLQEIPFEDPEYRLWWSEKGETLYRDAMYEYLSTAINPMTGQSLFTEAEATELATPKRMPMRDLDLFQRVERWRKSNIADERSVMEREIMSNPSLFEEFRRTFPEYWDEATFSIKHPEDMGTLEQLEDIISQQRFKDAPEDIKPYLTDTQGSLISLLEEMSPAEKEALGSKYRVPVEDDLEMFAGKLIYSSGLHATPADLIEDALNIGSVTLAEPTKPAVKKETGLTYPREEWPESLKTNNIDLEINNIREESRTRPETISEMQTFLRNLYGSEVPADGKWSDNFEYFLRQFVRNEMQVK